MEESDQGGSSFAGMVLPVKKGAERTVEILELQKGKLLVWMTWRERRKRGFVLH